MKNLKDYLKKFIIDNLDLLILLTVILTLLLTSSCKHAPQEEPIIKEDLCSYNINGYIVGCSIQVRGSSE